MNIYICIYIQDLQGSLRFALKISARVVLHPIRTRKQPSLNTALASMCFYTLLHDGIQRQRFQRWREMVHIDERSLITATAKC